MLGAGEVFTTDEHRRALVYALGASALTLEARAKPQARHSAEATLVRFGLRAAAA